MSKAKQSLITGALASSFGIFLSKLLGLLYVVPLNSYAGDANMVFYSLSYTYYDLLLRISGAGLPFAIAALVAKYYSRNDYKTVLLVKKLGSSFLLVSGFIVAVIFVLAANPFASYILGDQATQSDIATLVNLFYILAIALVLVPLLSSIRGYYQGLKMLNAYAASQVLEQLVRVGFIILGGFFVVNILKLEGIYAIYTAILAASIGALFAIIYLTLSLRKTNDEVHKLALEQTDTNRDSRSVFLELLSIGLPYLLVSLFAYFPTIVNSTFFIDYSTSAGADYENIKLVFGIIQVNLSKLSSIPLVLALGFSSGLVPYLTESLEKRDLKNLSKQVLLILNTLFFILVPMIAWLIVYARPVYYIMYGDSSLEIGSTILKFYMISVLFDTLNQLLCSMSITLRMRKNTLIILTLGNIIKVIAFFTFVRFMTYNGMILSDILVGAFVVISILVLIRNNFNVNYALFIKRAIFIIIASIISCLPILLINFVPFNFESRILCIIILGIYGLMSIAIYILIADFFGLLKAISGKDLKDHIYTLLNKLKA